MESFSAMFDAVVKNPTAALLVIALGAIAWLVKDQRARDLESRAREQALHDAHLKREQETNAAHLATAMQVTPLASKLAECVSLLERTVLAGLRDRA